MMKKRIKTLAITFSLLLLNVLIGELWHLGIIVDYPFFARGMLIISMVYVMGRCMLNSFGHPRASRILTIFAFLLLCVCVFYSTCMLDYAIFALSMFLLLRRASIDCECSCQHDPSDPKGQMGTL